MVACIDAYRTSPKASRDTSLTEWVTHGTRKVAHDIAHAWLAETADASSSPELAQQEFISWGIRHDIEECEFSALEQEFEGLAEEWRSDTIACGDTLRIFTHPAYQRIIGLGARALPLIFDDLEFNGGLWFWALQAITGENPARENASMREVRDAWLDYGRQKGYLHG